MGIAGDHRPLRRGSGSSRGLHLARAAPAAADARPRALQDRLLRGGEHRRDARLARDVRRLLLHLAVCAERPGLLADESGRDLPADDDPDHPHRADRREALGPRRVALADGRRHDHPRRLAPALSADRAAHRLLVAPAAARARRRRHGADDVADDVRRDGIGAGRQGRRRLRRAEQLPPGRRLARHRADGCDPPDLPASDDSRSRWPRSSSSTACTRRCSSVR